MSSPDTVSKSPPNPIMKPIIGSAVCFALDTFALKNTNQQAALTLAGAVGISLFLAPYIAKAMPFESTLSSIGTDGGISAELRVCEVAISLASAYGIEQYVFKQEILEVDLTTKMMLIVGSGFIAEYATDYLSGNKLNYIEGTGL